MTHADDALKNREVWTRANAEYTDRKARESWAKDEIDWGMFSGFESEIGALGEVAGKDVIELGCGTAYFGAGLAKRGARVTGIDVTPAQLETARRMSAEFDLPMTLVEASAEDVPLPDASFDLAVSEYGASIWCDPELWIAEAARLVRSGGRLAFLCNSTLSILCSPDEGKVEERLHRGHADLGRIEWPGEDEGVNYHLAHGELIRILTTNGFEVLALHERLAPASTSDHEYYDFVPAQWAACWPAEEIWVARKAA
ncbi:MAG TPA: class I SAM-dependent methyltransferase [Gaiellaceae bacterium]|jgi:SAM-dependent methyltransferase|nr:class I SAM-dependent methyltransferase [Gaiellaceae bacterium]